MMSKRITRLLSFLILAVYLLYPIRMDAASATDKDELVKKIYQAMCSRKSSVEIGYTKSDGWDIYEDYENLLNDICEMDSKRTTSDADYLKGILNTYGISYNGSKFTFSFTYYETLKQTQKVDAKVASVLEYMDIDSMTNYEKVKAIHDYIVKRVSYDQSLKATTAYAGLIKKSTVCSGYALIMYKMLNEAGVPTRIISGTASNGGSSGNHAWNMVKLGKRWYYVDATWDDPINGTMLYYDYFLKGSNEFKKDHFAEKKFRTSSFVKKYPISKTNYGE